MASQPPEESLLARCEVPIIDLAHIGKFPYDPQLFFVNLRITINNTVRPSISKVQKVHNFRAYKLPIYKLNKLFS